MRLRRRRGKRRLRAGQYFARGVAFLVFIAIVGTVRSVFALNTLSQARAELIDQLGPTALSANDISIAMLDQETGLRGYVLSGEESFLQPFRTGRTNADAALERLESQLRFDSVQPFRAEIVEIADAARDWERNYADEIVTELSSNPGGPRSVAQVEAGRAQFDRFRVARQPPQPAARTGARGRPPGAARQRAHRDVLGDLHRRRDPAQPRAGGPHAPARRW